MEVGARVIAGNKIGIVRFFGTTEFAPGDWVGVELSTPDGKNDGTVADIRYFNCPDKHGLCCS